MNLTTLIGIATAVTGLLAASLVARAFRRNQDVVRSLAARGTAVHQIARQTRMPEDVVKMLIAGSRVSAAPRQKVPTAVLKQTAANDAKRKLQATIARKAS